MNKELIYEMTDVNLKSLRRRMLEARCRKHKPISEIRTIIGKPMNYWHRNKLIHINSDDKYTVTMMSYK